MLRKSFNAKKFAGKASIAIDSIFEFKSLKSGLLDKDKCPRQRINA